MKIQERNEMYGRPKIAPAKYNKLSIIELANIFKAFNSEKLNGYFEDDCFSGIKNYYGKNELIESIRDDNFRYGLIQYFNDEFVSIYLHIPYKYDEFYMPKDLIKGYDKQIPKEKFDEICQKLADIDTVFELKMYPIGKKEFIFLFAMIYCIAKMTEGLVITDNVWFGNFKNEIPIERVYDVDMLEHLKMRYQLKEYMTWICLNNC